MTTNVYLAVGPFCWGRGNTVAEALKNARANFSRTYVRKLKPGEPVYRVYEVHPDSYVSEMGGITHPQAHPPKKVGAFSVSLKAVEEK